MKLGKNDLIHFGFRFLGTAGLHRAAQKFTQGLGAILMFHRVRAAEATPFAPNKGLEISPRFLDLVLTRVQEARYDLVTLTEARERIIRGFSKNPFLAITFDDGYRDTVETALPVLARHGAPFTVFVTSGFADRTARLWWIELERAILALDRINVRRGDFEFQAPTRSPAEKLNAFQSLYWRMREGSQHQLLEVCADLCHQASLDPLSITEELCMDWAGVRALSQHKLATIGAHTLSHVMLAKSEAGEARRQMLESRSRIHERIEREVAHFAYPVGDHSSAGAREFSIAHELGFETAVTTRPGMVFPNHARHLTALPRLSVNGNHQTWKAMEILLSGAPFFLWNRGRRLSIH